VYISTTNMLNKTVFVRTCQIMSGHFLIVWVYFKPCVGVTVWEIMTFGAHPYHGKQTEDMLKALEDGQRLQQPVTVTADLHSVLVTCERMNFKLRKYMFIHITISCRLVA